MPLVPLGSEINLALQIIALVLLLVGLRYAILTHNGFHMKDTAMASSPTVQRGSVSHESTAPKHGIAPERTEFIHKNIMTLAVVVSGIGVLIWMIPNLILGWFYSSSGLGYGSGGYLSYFEFGGVYNPHWYLIDLMIVVGSLTAILGIGIYLVLRMRWSEFPKQLAIQNFRGLMIVTWSLWFLNIILGFAVFYFFAYLQTG